MINDRVTMDETLPEFRRVRICFRSPRNTLNGKCVRTQEREVAVRSREKRERERERESAVLGKASTFSLKRAAEWRNSFGEIGYLRKCHSVAICVRSREDSPYKRRQHRTEFFCVCMCVCVQASVCVCVCVSA